MIATKKQIKAIENLSAFLDIKPEKPNSREDASRIIKNLISSVKDFENDAMSAEIY